MTGKGTESLLEVGSRVWVDGGGEGSFVGYDDETTRDGAGLFVLVALDADEAEEPDYRVSRWHPRRVKTL